MLPYFEIKKFADLYDLFIRIKRGDILAIMNTHRGVTLYYWFLEGVLGYSYGYEEDTDGYWEPCASESQFYNDIVLYLKADDYELYIMTPDDLIPLYLNYTAEV